MAGSRVVAGLPALSWGLVKPCDRRRQNTLFDDRVVDGLTISPLVAVAGDAGSESELARRSDDGAAANDAPLTFL
jgi:hypothetical protein